MRRNGTAVGELARACARRGIDLVFISTNEVFDGRADRRHRLRPRRRAEPDQPVRRREGRGRAAGDRGVRGRRRARPPRDRAHLLAVRPARQRLPGQDRGRGPPGAGRRASRSASSRTRSACPPTRPTSPRRSSSCSPRMRSPRRPARAGDPPPRQRRPRVPRRLGPRGPARDADRRRGRGRPGQHLAARLHAAGLGRAGAHAPAVRRADARLAGGLRRRRAGPGAFAQQGPDPHRTHPEPDRQPHSGPGPKGPRPRPDHPAMASDRARGDAGGHSSTAGASPGAPPQRSPSIAQDRSSRSPPSSLAGLGAVHPRRRTRRVRRRTSRSRSSWAPRTTRRRQYRSYADQIYSDAIRYTSNVVRVYSPNATASKVKAAVAGASIIVYLGHGNGWPSPYTYDPNYTTKDGFGLNYDANGDGKTTRLREQVLRRALDPRRSAPPPTPSSCCSTSATRPATRVRPGGAQPVERQAARGQLRRGLHQGGRPRRHRQRPQPRPVLHRRAVHHPPDHRRVLAQRPGRARQRHDLRLGAQPGLHVPDGPGVAPATTTAPSPAR